MAWCVLRRPTASRSGVPGWQILHPEGMDAVLAAVPPEFLQVSFSERMIPGRQSELGLTAGSNCQRYACAVLRHFGLSVPDLRSSDLWADEELLATVSEPESLDLVLFAASPDPWGAHVGVYLGGAERRSSIFARRSASPSSGSSRTSLSANAMHR